MSSILRALKKLESEPQHLEKSRGVDHKYISLAGPEHRRSAFRPLVLFIGGGIACGMVLLAGWWLMREQPQPVTPVIQESLKTAGTEDAVEPQKTVAAKPETSPPVTEQEQPASQPTTALAPAEPVSQPVAPAAPVDSRMEQIAPVLADKPALNIPEEEAFRTIPVATEDPAGQLSEKPAAREETIETAVVDIDPPVEKKPEIPLLKDPDVKLQSISWSKTPSKRLAVISNRIVREGGTTSGYVIVTINKDDVVLSQNGEQWRINFRTK